VRGPVMSMQVPDAKQPDRSDEQMIPVAVTR